MTGPVPTLVLTEAQVLRLRGHHYPPPLPISALGSYIMSRNPRLMHPLRLNDEVAAWCAENMFRSVVPIISSSTGNRELSFGCDTDHVLFKLRWY